MKIELYTPSLIFMAGFCAYSALQHCNLEQRRPQRRLHLLFGGISLLMSLFALSTVQIFQMTTVADYIPMLRLNLAFYIMLVALLPWFFAEYTGIRPKPVLAGLTGLTGLSAVLFCANLILPYTILYREIHGFEHVLLPWGETITLPLTTRSNWSHVGVADMVLVFSFAFYTLAGRFRRDHRRTALVMMLAMGLFLAATIQGSLVRLGIIHFLPLGVFGYLGMLIIMGLTLNYDIREERKRAEEKFRNIFENAPIGIFQSLPSGQFITANTVYARIFGFDTAEEMISGVSSIPYQLYAHPKQRKEILRQLETADMVIKEDLEAIRKDGAHFYVSLYMRAIRGESGGLEMLEGFLMDVSERKRARDELYEREERMRLYIERLPVACIAFDKDSIVQNWNPAAERVFGYLRDEAIGRKAAELLAPQHAWPQVEQAWQRLLAGDLKAMSTTNENVTKDGRTILCEWTNTPFHDAKGEVSGVISVAQDITEWKLAQEMMIQNEKMALVGGLAAGLAHEINNPIGIIVQALQIMERRLSPELEANSRIAAETGVDLNLVRKYLEKREIFDFITSMREAGKRTTKIITNMLQFTRKSDSWNQVSNLPDVVEQAIEMSESDYDLRKKYDIRNVKIERTYEHDLPQISINITEIEQVLINLIKNAAQAMFENGAIAEPTIRISVSRHGESLVMKVADNGPGMTNDVKKRIFEPFYTTKEVGTGTGLGLAVSYMLITNNHRGSFEVESSPGEGTCFTINLPLVNRPKDTP
jgi:PAS domain S-box-containing protein